MDGQRFDQLVRSLSSQPSRRGLLGGLTGGILGGVLGLLGLDEAEGAPGKKRAAAKKKPKKCPKGRKKCGKKCCPKGKVCRKRKCVRPPATQPPPANPGCAPLSLAAACGSRQCGPVSDGCAGTYLCGPDNGVCPDGGVCSDNGICNCAPVDRAAACGAQECGTAPDGCGDDYQCGPNNGGCPGTETCSGGQCVCTPIPRATACGSQECGTAPNGCGQTYNCGPNEGGCPGNGVCQGNGTCVCTPIPRAQACAGIQCGQASNGCGGTYNCTDCEGCCDGGICREGFEVNAGSCGHSGAPCTACNPEVACVNGVCTCTGNSCAQGCCTVVNGQPFCDNTLRRCGDTCIPKEACCHGRDATFYQTTTPGCWGPEICSGVNSQGAGQCRCGSEICDPWGSSPGCCSLDGNGQPFCDRTKRRCGNVCIDKTACCHDGQLGCNDDVSCTTETCVPATGTGQNPPPGICEVTVSGVCLGACAAGKGFGNYFPANERDVICGRASSGGLCYCWRTMDGTADGANVCVEDGNGPPCRGNADCGAQEVCIRSGLSGIEHTCARICQ